MMVVKYKCLDYGGTLMKKKAFEEGYAIGAWIRDFIITMIFLGLVLILIIPLSIWSIGGNS